jgi:hypothetical protein
MKKTLLLSVFALLTATAASDRTKDAEISCPEFPAKITISQTTQKTAAELVAVCRDTLMVREAAQNQFRASWETLISDSCNGSGAVASGDCTTESVLDYFDFSLAAKTLRDTQKPFRGAVRKFIRSLRLSGDGGGKNAAIIRAWLWKIAPTEILLEATSREMLRRQQKQ